MLTENNILSIPMLARDTIVLLKHRNKMKIKKILTLFVLSAIIILFIFYKRNQVYNTIESEQMTIYLYFDSFTKQYGYPKNKNEFKNFIKYYENVNNNKSKVWSYDFDFTNKNDLIIIDLNSIYFLTKINILKVEKRH